MERHTDGNGLECLARGRVCFQGFMQEQVSSGRMATIFVFGVFLRNYSAKIQIFGLLFGPNRIRIEYSVQP